MTQEWTVPAWLVVAVLLALVLVAASGALLALRQRRGSVRARAVAEAETAALRAKVDDIERRLAARPATSRRAGVDEREFVITGLGEPGALRREAPAEPVPTVEAGLFADIVLRETVLQSASLVHGLRRALSPEVRNRIRFEMKREVKRSRKQRRAELREARRDWEARQRADLADAGTTR